MYADELKKVIKYPESYYITDYPGAFHEVLARIIEAMLKGYTQVSVSKNRNVRSTVPRADFKAMMFLLEDEGFSVKEVWEDVYTVVWSEAKRNDIMEEDFVTAESMRDKTKKAKEQDAVTRKKKAMESEYYQTVLDMIDKAAEQGENHVMFYPKPVEYFDNLFENNKIFPAEDKKFSEEQTMVLQALQEFGGFNLQLMSCPVSYGSEGATKDRIQQATLYW